MPLRTLTGKHADPRKGRGAGVNPEGRFEQVGREGYDDGWESAAQDEERALKTIVTDERAKSIIARNDSPDIPFTQSINPYQGCEHGCIYCYARNTYEYYGFSAGLDFESKIIVKQNAPQLLEQQLLNKNWNAVPIMLSGNTDCYQPIERKLEITRRLLKVLVQYRHPVSIKQFGNPRY